MKGKRRRREKERRRTTSEENGRERRTTGYENTQLTYTQDLQHTIPISFKRMSAAYSVIALILFLLVYIVGLIGNGLLMFIVFRQKNLRTVPNLLVVNLSLGDFLFVLFCVPFGAIAYSFKHYPFSTFYCRFENFIINLSLGVSVFSLLALSADRYKIIAKPFSTHANDPSKKLKIVVILIWLSSIILALPETIYSGLITYTVNVTENTTTQLSYCWSPNDNALLSNHKFMIARQILRLIVYYLMPFICISVFYSSIAKTLFQSKNVIYTPTASASCSFRNDRNNTEENRAVKIQLSNHSRQSFYQNQTTTNLVNQDTRTKKQLRARHKVAKTVLFLCLVFFVCWLPKQLHDLYWFIGVLVYQANWNHFWQINKTIALILTYIYSCINPLALYFLSSTFRHFYKRYLCFWSNTTCGLPRHAAKSKPRRDHLDMTTTSQNARQSSLNVTNATLYFDLNRVKASNHCQRQSP